MNYYTVKNKSGAPNRYFAENLESVINMAVAEGHVRKPENATVTAVFPICSVCCPYEGRAIKELAPQPGWLAWCPYTKESHRQPRDAGSLAECEHTS